MPLRKGLKVARTANALPADEQRGYLAKLARNVRRDVLAVPVERGDPPMPRRHHAGVDGGALPPALLTQLEQHLTA